MKRFLLILTAGGWGWLVYMVHQGLGYEKGTGYPAQIVSIGLALLAAAPLLAGPFVVKARRGWRKYLRWVCATWLGVQGGFLVLFTWLGVYGLVPLFGVGVLLWPNPVAPMENPGHPQKRTYAWRGPALFLSVITFILYWWHYNPLPSDEEMIAHFHAHQSDIEELVRRYRDWAPSEAVPNWHAVNANKELMMKAGVRRLICRGHWPPNPYSKTAMEAFFNNRDYRENYYCSVEVELIDHRKRDFADVLTSSGPRVIKKALVFIPQSARVDLERLWEPVHPSLGNSQTNRVFPSLDVYPPNWRTGECVYRQFSAHWYLCLCTLAV